METPRTPISVKIGWRRDGKSSTEAEADDWHLRFDLTTDSGNGGSGNAAWMCAAYRQYGIYHAATPADWEAFLAPDGEGCKDEQCIGGACPDAIAGLHRCRKKGSVRITVETEGLDDDSSLRVAVPADAILPALRDAIAQVTKSGKYYPGMWAAHYAEKAAKVVEDSEYSTLSALSCGLE